MALLDGILGTQIIDLVGLSAIDIRNPKKYAKLEQITVYFQGLDTAEIKYKVLKILQGRPGDKLDVLWEFVELKNLKKEKLAKLDPQDFEPDIAAELNQKQLSLDKLARVKEAVSKRRQTLQQKKLKKQETDDTSAEELAETAKLTHIATTVAEVEDINKILEYYE